ncbi:hypothetical protein EVAR_10339_1 [Eumeta japonica]|uniref:Uncharacterized protein n=1 Tax=Eumeta variegata TaxID=151549 RepID=A0A4C1TGY8_EUMVA|nr:hypothetical protein EVAR_10339_1 [Eumeta japonica]
MNAAADTCTFRREGAMLQTGLHVRLRVSYQVDHTEHACLRIASRRILGESDIEHIPLETEKEKDPVSGAERQELNLFCNYMDIGSDIAEETYNQRNLHSHPRRCEECMNS